MTKDQDQFEQIIEDIVRAIYISETIPEDHKQKYVDHIKRNGITEKMITELSKAFAQDEKSVQGQIETNESIIKGLDEVIESEQADIDRPQAEIVASVDTHMEKKKKAFQEGLSNIEQDMSEVLEEVAESAEESEEEAIRAKLLGKKD